MNDSEPSSSDAAELDLRSIISDLVIRLAAGESVSEEDTIRQHPSYARPLRDWFAKLKIVSGAAELADGRFAQTVIDPQNAATPAEYKTQPDEGDQIGHYRLVVAIGSGGFGTVWKAHDLKLECEVAVKIPRLEKLSPQAIDRFIHEARVAAQLRKHPNIVSVHEAKWENEIAFIASDYIDGDSLATELDTGPLQRDEAVKLVLAVCDALQHAHDAGIIHRDLKPDNILLDANGTPHVTDFGLARKEHQDLHDGAGQIMGTVLYMPPEQARGDSEKADCRSDVYSLGVVLYELLTGELPFRGSFDHILQQVIDEDPPRLRDFNPQIDLDIETICLKCLEKDPSLRYQTMKALEADLLRHQKGQPIEARPISGAGKLWRWCKRHPVIPWLSVSLVLVALAASATTGVILNRHVADNQDEVINVTKDLLKTAAVPAKRDAELTLDEGFEAVEAMSKNDDLIKALQVANESTDPLTWDKLNLHDTEGLNAELQSAAKPVATGDTGATAAKSRLLEDFDFPAPVIPIELVLIETAGAKNSTLNTFSWFVCGQDGQQIARFPVKETLGQDMRYRSYFNGTREYKGTTGPQNHQDNPRIVVKHKGWDNARLSDSFITVTNDAAVVAISIPVRNQKNEVLGVVGLFVELGQLLELPPARSVGSEGMKLNIYDSNNDRSALLIHSEELPAYIEKLLERNDRRYDWPPSELIVDLGDSNISDGIHPLTDFRDPLDDSGTSEWIAMHGILSVPPSSTDAKRKLHVVIYASVDSIAKPGQHLQSRLIFLGLSVLGLSTAILVPVWTIIMRRVLKE